MQHKKTHKRPKIRLAGMVIPIVLVILLKWLALYPDLTERYYTGMFYPLVSRFLRLLTGWLPFSLGDLLYLLAGTWVLIRLFMVVRALFRRSITKASVQASLYRTAIIILWVYICFNLFWGLNYDRQGIAHQLGLQPASYTKEELVSLTGGLVDAVNTTRSTIPDTAIEYSNHGQVYGSAVVAYDSAARTFPFLQYSGASVKGSLFSTINSYMGVFGYYNPFSGEAQVNTRVPGFLVPFTVCHEIGHQLGYATEDEANFAGYLAAVSSPDNRFRYSALFEMYIYANRQLYMLDSAAALRNSQRLDTLVKMDIRRYKAFLARYKNPVEPFITAFYDRYLQANNQPGGMYTYDEVVGWLLAYRKKYGNNPSPVLQ